MKQKLSFATMIGKTIEAMERRKEPGAKTRHVNLDPHMMLSDFAVVE
jgi:hypothetical protein